MEYKYVAPSEEARMLRSEWLRASCRVETPEGSFQLAEIYRNRRIIC